MNLAEVINATTLPLGVTVTSIATISTLSASEIISSNSGMITLATRGVSRIEDIVTTWSVLEKAQKPILGVVLADPTK